jgi:hypothetical protein
MSQIPGLLDDFNTAMAVIKQKMDTPQVSQAEQTLTQELGEATAKMTALEGDLDTQKANYQSLSEEFGELELSLLKVQQDDSAKNEIEDLTHKLSGLTVASEEKIAQLRTETSTLQNKLNDAATKEADLQATITASQNNGLEEIKQQHSSDIAAVQEILNQLKPLVEE